MHTHALVYYFLSDFKFQIYLRRFYCVTTSLENRNRFLRSWRFSMSGVGDDCIAFQNIQLQSKVEALLCETHGYWKY